MPARKRNTAEEECPDGPGAMAARQQLGRLLRDLRTAKDITQDEAAQHIERVPSTLYRIEDGQPGVRIKPGADIGRLCDLYEVTDQEIRNGLLRLAEATRTKGWFQPYLSVIPSNFDMYLGLEDDASELWMYQPELIPGLLQTDEYARAIFEIPGPSGLERDRQDVDRRVRLRLQRRHTVLARKTPRPPRVEIVIGEAALRRPIGSEAITAAQLRYLNQTAADLMNVSVRVLPFSAGLHEGLMSGGFIVMRFRDQSLPTRVWSESMMGHLCFDKPKEVDRYESVLADIRKHCLGEERSYDMIDQAAEEFTNDG